MHTSSQVEAPIKEITAETLRQIGNKHRVLLGSYWGLTEEQIEQAFGNWETRRFEFWKYDFEN